MARSTARCESTWYGPTRHGTTCTTRYASARNGSSRNGPCSKICYPRRTTGPPSNDWRISAAANVTSAAWAAADADAATADDDENGTAAGAADAYDGTRYNTTKTRDAEDDVPTGTGNW